MSRSASARCAAFAALLALSGCNTPKWPTPPHTNDLVLQDNRRNAIATVDLADALHIILPPPIKTGTQWQLLQANDIVLRQMTALQPVANARIGTCEITFQAVHVISRTMVRFAAVPENAAAADASESFTVNVGIKRPGD